MKKILILILFFSGAALWANQQKLEKALILLADSLSSSYLENENDVFRLNISIGEIDNKSASAEKLQMGQAVREILLTIFSRSNVFAVIDRSRLDQVLEEQKMQLSGMTSSEDAVEIGNLLNARVVLTGSVSGIAGSYVISCQLLDVETGRVTAEQTSIPADIITDAAEKRLDMMYVQPMGIGISISGVGINVAGNNPTIIPFPEENLTIFRRNFSLELRYRITSWLMAAIGAEYIYGQLVHLDAVGLNLAFRQAYTTLYGIGSLPTALATGGTLPFNIIGEGFGIPLKLSFVLTPVRWLNVSASLGGELYLLDFSGYFSPSNGLGFGVNEYGPGIHKEFFSAIGQAGIEIFVSPRLAFSLDLGYEYGISEIIGTDNSAIFDYFTGFSLPVTADISGFSMAFRINLYF